MKEKKGTDKKSRQQSNTSSATFERALYNPIHTGIVARVGKHPGKKDEAGNYID